MITSYLHLALGMLTASAAVARPVLPQESNASSLTGRTPGKPMSCLSIDAVVGSEPDHGRIIFRGRGSHTLFTNTPTSGGDLLRDNVYLVIRTSSAALCRSATVQVVNRASHIEQGTVVLGDFVPWSIGARH